MRAGLLAVINLVITVIPVITPFLVSTDSLGTLPDNIKGEEKEEGRKEGGLVL